MSSRKTYRISEACQSVLEKFREDFKRKNFYGSITENEALNRVVESYPQISKLETELAKANQRNIALANEVFEFREFFKTFQKMLPATDTKPAPAGPPSFSQAEIEEMILAQVRKEVRKATAKQLKAGPDQGRPQLQIDSKPAKASKPGTNNLTAKP